jgi:K+-transporting ATPase KdpF subunit
MALTILGWVVGAIVVLLFGYLLVALLKPESFS